MERIKLFLYFIVTGAVCILPVTALAYIADITWSRYPWIIVIAPMIVGALAGIWANVFKGKSFGVKKGMLTTFLSHLSFTGLFGIYLEGFTAGALEAFIGYTFFLGVGTLYLLFWILPIGAAAGALYEARPNKSLKNGKRKELHAPYLKR